VVDLYEESFDTVHVDFDPILVEELNEPPASSSARARPTTTAMIQEHGVASILAAERASSGNAVGLRNRWRCDNTHCGNHRYTCWLQPGQPQRFENHYPINANPIAIRAINIDDRKATFDKPSNSVRLGILRSKERAEPEKAQRRRSSSPDEDTKSFTKLLIIRQLAQMQKQPAAEASPILCTPEEPSAAAEEPSEWVPIEYDHPMETTEHTVNFFNDLIRKYIQDSDLPTTICRRVIKESAMDIDLLMTGHENILKLWCDHWDQPVGWLYRIHSFGPEWQKTYAGLSAKSCRQVDRAHQRDRALRQNLRKERSSSIIEELED
jgi:hypothetical protein